MKNKHPSLLSVFILIFFSCNTDLRNADTGYYFQDFDNLNMWARNQQVTTEQAHSGNFSTYTDSTHEYSGGFEMDLNYAKSKRYKNMHLAAWCLVTTAGIKADLVASVENPEKVLLYGDVNFYKALNKVNKWTKVHGYLKLPVNTPPNSKIKVYLYSPHKQKIFLDDVEIQFFN